MAMCKRRNLLALGMGTRLSRKWNIHTYDHLREHTSCLGVTEESEKVLQRIIDLLVAAGYVRAQATTLPPFDKLTGGLAWCITAWDVDVDIDLFYDDNATLEHKLKVGEAIEAALQKLECPHLLQAHQIQGLDYPAVHLVMQWLVENSSTIQAKMCNQVFSLAIKKRKSFPQDANRQLKFEAVALLKQIAELEKTNRSLQEQKTDLEVEFLKTKEKRKGQEREEAQLVLETKVLKEKVEKAGSVELVQKLLPLLEQSKVSPQEELLFQSSCRQQHAELPLEAEEKQCKVRVCKANVEPILQQDIMKLKLLKGDMATKNQKFVLYRRKLDEVPCHTELMQYERCFVDLYLRIQEKLQETRKHFATYNALAEANELTLKEISLLDSIHAQFEEVVKSQRGRTKLVASMSDIAKGMSQKVEKMEARLLAEQDSLSALKKRHSQLVAERRRYENLMDLFQDACTKNELLRSSLHQET
ncbi:hypothetical protein L7F22_005135 [Adiantum nelumboides]|nr:hypothetical protein [Adiantum nelumboides]